MCVCVRVGHCVCADAKHRKRKNRLRTMHWPVVLRFALEVVSANDIGNFSK